MEKLSRKQVLDIYHALGTLQEVGARFNISPAHVGCIKRGVSHGAVTGASVAENKRKVLSADLIRKITEHTGTVRAAAQEFGVAESTIKKYRGLMPRKALGRLTRNKAGQFTHEPLPAEDP